MVDEKNSKSILFALAMVIIPALFHFGRGIQNDGGAFWPEIISTSGPYVFLALLFLAHFQKSQRSAYCGAITAWLIMVGCTVYLIFLTPSPKGESMLAIVVVLPIVSIPYLILPSFISGATAGRVWAKWEEKAQKRCQEPFS